MAIRDTLAPLIQLLLFVCYGVYLFLGLLLMAFGIYYISQVKGANDFVAIVGIGAGFFMLLVGALAIFANLKKNALLLVVVLFVDIFLFIFLLAAMMVGMAIVNEVKDPVAKAVRESYCDRPSGAYCKAGATYDVDGVGVTTRQQNWDGVKELFGKGAPVACKKYDEQITAQVLAKNAATANNYYFSKMLTPVIGIAEILPAVAVTAECKAGGDASAADMTTASKVATECTAVVAEAPAACAKQAPVDAGSFCTPFPSYDGCAYTAASCTAAENPAYCTVASGTGTCTLTSGACVASAATTCTLVAAATGGGSCTKATGTKYNDASSCVATQTDGTCAVATGAGTCTDTGTPITSCTVVPVSGETTATTCTYTPPVPTNCGWTAASCSGTSKTAPSCATGSTLNEDWTKCIKIVDGADLGTTGLVTAADGTTANDCVLATKQIWSSFMGVKPDSCNTATGCEKAAGETPSVVCTTAATGCEVKTAATMDGHCTLTQPADEIGRVLPVATKTQSCPISCFETLEVVAVDAVVEACNVKRPQGRTATCVGTGSATDAQKAKCTAAAIDVNLWGAACAKSAASVTATHAGTCQLTVGGAGCEAVDSAASCTVLATKTGTCALNANKDACVTTQHASDGSTDTTCTFNVAVSKNAALTCAFSSKGTGLTTTGTGTGTAPAAFSAVAPTDAETAAEKKICTDASLDTADATISHCIYLEQLSCGLNRKTIDGTLTGTALTAAQAEGFTCDAGLALTDAGGECAHVLPAPAVAYVAADCAMQGTAGAAKYATGKADAMVSADKCLDTATCATKGTFAGNCSAVEGLFGDGIGGVPASCTVLATKTGTCALNANKDDCVATQHATDTTTDTTCTFNAATNTYSAVTDECETCWDHWQLYLIDQVKGNMWAATIVVWALFLFVVILVCLNYYMIDNCEDDDGNFGVGGLVKILGLVFNGIVCLFGLITMIMGIVVQVGLNEDCPDGKDCTNWAVAGLIVLGIFFFLCAILSLVGLLLGGFPGKMLIRVANLIFLLFGLLLMIVGVGFAIVAGAMNDINSQYDENFATVRAQYESEDPAICAGLGEDACKSKIKDKAEGSMSGLLVVLGLICFGMLFIMFLTLEAFYIYKGGDDDDDDDDDGEE